MEYQMWFLLSFLLINSAYSADPNSPHPHQGVITPFENPQRTTLSAAEEATLLAGKSIKKQVKEGNGGRGIAILDVNASPEKVWSTITNYSQYPKWIDELSVCEVYKSDSQSIYARFIISTMMIKVEYFIHHKLNKDKGYLTWTLDYARESDLDDSIGYWLIYPSPADPQKTRVEYSVNIRIKGWVPTFIEDLMADQGLEDATRWLKRESEKG
jgi:ribosome-associated toxin RatA of RatAB toxin-antitoxin module